MGYVKYDLYSDMLRQTHLLIAGSSGSGKSVVINGIIHTALLTTTPEECRFIFLDPKRVELSEYRTVKHCLFYASEVPDMIRGLQLAMQITEDRYKQMAAAGLRKYPGGDIYVICDETADLMSVCKKQAEPLLIRLGQIARAARVHLILATQCPLSSVLTTPLKVNLDSRVGLRTRSAQDSRNILGIAGLETLPRYGSGIYMTPEGMTRYKIPMYSDADRRAMIEYWTLGKRKRKRGIFKKRD